MERGIIFHFILIIVATTQTTAVVSDSPRKPIIFGLLSKCQDNNVMGTSASKHIKKVFALFRNLYVYKEFDVCESEKLLMEIIVNISLSKGMYVNRTMISASIIALMPDHMLRMTVKMLSFTKINIYSLTKTKDCSWFDLQTNFKPVYSTELVVEPIIARLIVKYKWLNSIVIEVSNSPKVNIDSLRQDIPIHHCIRYIALHMSSFQNASKLQRIFKILKKDNQLKTVFLVGHLTGKFLHLAEKFNVTDLYWILFDNYVGGRNQRIKEYVVFTNIKSGREVLEMPSYHNDTKCSDKFYSVVPKRLKSKLESSCPAIITTIHDKKFPSINHFKSFYKQNYNLVYRIFGMMMNKNKFVAKVNAYQLSNGQSKQLKSAFEMMETPTLLKSKNSQCPSADYIPSCKKIDILVFKTKYFMKQIDYCCIKCNPSFIKDKEGGCKLCQGGFIPLENQIGCYNPFIPETVYKVSYVLHGFGGVVSLFILIVFVRFRKTPVVRSSHSILSITQILICLIQFLMFPLFVLIKPTAWVCTVRQTLVSMVLVATVGIVVCKAEKIITIYSRKTLMREKDKRDLLVKQMLIFCFIMFVDAIVIVSCFPFPSHPRATFAKIIDGNKYYFVHCDIGDKAIVQVIYCIILLVVSIVQAYRGKKLPDAYNESNSIITSSATSACCLLFLTIYSKRQKHYERDFISIITISLSISLIVMLLCLYGNKVYIILFKRSLNTKTYVETYIKTMERVENYLQQRTNGTADLHQGGSPLLTHESLSCAVSSEI